MCVGSLLKCQKDTDPTDRPHSSSQGSQSGEGLAAHWRSSTPVFNVSNTSMNSEKASAASAGGGDVGVFGNEAATAATVSSCSVASTESTGPNARRGLTRRGSGDRWGSLRTTGGNWELRNGCGGGAGEVAFGTVPEDSAVDCATPGVQLASESRLTCGSVKSTNRTFAA